MPEPVEGRSAFFHLVISTSSITVLYLLLLSVPEPVEGTFLFLFLWFRLRSITVLLSVPEPVEGTFSLILPVISTSSITVLLSVPEPVEGTFSLILPVISAPLNHRVTFGAWACRRQILIPPGDFDKLNHRVTPGAWACRRHILTHTPCDFGSAQSPCYSRCLSLSKAQYINPYPYNFLIIKANRLLCSPSKPLSFSCSNPEPAFLDKKLHLFCQILRNRPIAQATFFGCG